jgi:hypothetical protein
MSDNEDDRPIMPLEPPANVPELRPAYDQELFEYHQKLRAWRARQSDQQTPVVTPGEVAPFVHEYFRVGIIHKSPDVRDVVLAETLHGYGFTFCTDHDGEKIMLWPSLTDVPFRAIGVVISVEPEKSKG